jgi:hypothetical protein
MPKAKAKKIKDTESVGTKKLNKSPSKKMKSGTTNAVSPRSKSKTPVKKK